MDSPGSSTSNNSRLSIQFLLDSPPLGSYVDPSAPAELPLPSVDTLQAEQEQEPEDDVVMAARALDKLRVHRSRSSSTLNESLGESLESLSETSQQIKNKRADYVHVNPPEWVNRVSNHPLITHAVKAYESSKSNYPSFKYGAEMVENMAKPVVRKINKQYIYRQRQKQLQLHQQRTQQRHTATPQRWTDALGNALTPESRRRLRVCLHLLKLANNTLNVKIKRLSDIIEEEEASQFQNSDSIDKNMALEFENESQHDNNKNEKNEDSTNGNVKTIKADIITTVKKIVNVVSNYGCNTLPEPARSKVRESLLKLPSNWIKSVNTVSQIQSTNSSPKLSPMTPVTPSSQLIQSPSPMLTPTSNQQDSNNFNNFITPASPTPSMTSTSTTSTIASQSQIQSQSQLQRHDSIIPIPYLHPDTRVLVLARESLVMVSNVIKVVDDTLDKAEGWVDNLERGKKQRLDVDQSSPSSVSNLTSPHNQKIKSEITTYTNTTSTTNLNKNNDDDENLENESNDIVMNDA